jgi:hypothetical protein
MSNLQTSAAFHRIRALRAAALSLAFLPLWHVPAPVQGQVVTGHVVDALDGTPLRGAFVRLIDAAGRQRVATVTDSAGAFALRPPATGHYRVAADQIGFGTAISDLLLLEPDATQQISLPMEARAFALAPVTAEARSLCGARPDRGGDTQRLWDEARKALDVAAWADASAALLFELTTYRRSLDREGRPVGPLPDDTAVGIAQRPFETRPADDLVNKGFIQPVGDGSFMFYAPDAQVLLSDAFLSTHCFRVERARIERHRGMVGLAFEPLGRRTVSDIEGVLWLDAATGVLRTLEYIYHRVPWGQPNGSAHGRVDFRRLADGAWIIERWSIRIPRLEAMPPRLAAPRRQVLRLAGYEEAGGEVRALTSLERSHDPDTAF